MICAESGRKIKIELDLDIEEIILIKESLYESIQKQKMVARNPRTSIAFVGVSAKKADDLQKLLERLSIYGCGYRG